MNVTLPAAADVFNNRPANRTGGFRLRRWSDRLFSIFFDIYKKCQKKNKRDIIDSCKQTFAAPQLFALHAVWGKNHGIKAPLEHVWISKKKKQHTTFFKHGHLVCRRHLLGRRIWRFEVGEDERFAALCKHR